MRSGEGNFLRKPDKFDCDYGGGKNVKWIQRKRGLCRFRRPDEFGQCSYGPEKAASCKGRTGYGQDEISGGYRRFPRHGAHHLEHQVHDESADGLYVYDTVQRLYDSQFGEANVGDISKYIKLGKMGEAFKSDKQVVLLIDEIDKADLEFPNDLLWELDKMEFYINETKETVRAKHRPIVIITSNAEKELPDAFLRRCIFHYIEFPLAPKMREIVNVHYKDLDETLINQAMEAFYWIRSMNEIQKKPSTSELLDWLQALSLGGIDPEKVASNFPFIGTLLKKNQDIDTFESYKKGRIRFR